MSQGVSYVVPTARRWPCIVFCTTSNCCLSQATAAARRHKFNNLQQNTQKIFLKITPTPA